MLPRTMSRGMKGALAATMGPASWARARRRSSATVVAAISSLIAMIELGTRRSFEALIRIMSEAEPGSYEWHSVAAVIAIFLCKNDWDAEQVREVPGAYETLVRYINFPHDPWPWTVARLIGRLEYRPGVPRLYQYVTAPEGGIVRRTAEEALKRLGCPLPASMPVTTRP